MKKETTIALISLLIVSLIVTYYYKKDGDTKPKVGLGKEITLNKVDTLRSYSNEAVMIETIYTYQGDNLDMKRKLANKNRIRNFIIAKSSIELYELKLPHILNGYNIVITNINIEAEILPKVKKTKRERDAIMDILIDKIENNEWEMKYDEGVRIMYNKRDSLEIFQLIINDVVVMFKGKRLQLSKKEQLIIDACIEKRLTYDRMNDEEKTKREFLKKFGKKK